MAAYLTNAWDEIFTQVKTTLSTVTVMLESQEAAVINWQELVEDSELTPPYAIIRSMPLEPTMEHGLNNECYFLPVEIYWIISTRSNTDNERNVEASIEALRDAFRAATYTYIQLTGEDPVINCSVDNPANQYFAANQKPFRCGMLGLKLLIGQTYA